MLTPGQEISARYLRTLRQTLGEIILPEVTSPAARNAVTLCDFVLVRMIAALDTLPSVQTDHDARYRHLARDAARLTGAQPLPDAAPLWSVARHIQASVPRLFDLVATKGAHFDIHRLLVDIAECEAAFRRDYEKGAAQAAAATEPVPRALLVTGDTVQRYLDARFGDGSVRVTSCHQIPGGRSKLTVLLAVETDGRVPADMVIRIDGPGSAIDTTVLDEFPILDAMFREGIAAPEPLWVEPDSSHLGAPFLVMRRMPGAAAGDLWGAAQVSPSIGLALAEALASVHSAEVARIWPMAPASSRDAVLAMIDRFEQGWRGGDSTVSVVMECAYAWLRRHISAIEGPTVAVHGDAHFANLLADGDRLVCLLDWEFAHPGHPADDLAYCRNYVETIMPWADFIGHYRSHGGAIVTEKQLRFFKVWGLLRNLTFGANMLRDFAAGKVHGIQNLAIALNTRAKLEALLAEAISTALDGDAASASP